VNPYDCHSGGIPVAIVITPFVDSRIEKRKEGSVVYTTKRVEVEIVVF
jgi:hypothetical protein